MKNQKKQGISPVKTAMAGAIVGASVAIAGAIALSNKNNQRKIKGVLTDVKNKMKGYERDMETKKALVEKKVAEGRGKATKTIKTFEGANKKVKNIWQK